MVGLAQRLSEDQDLRIQTSSMTQIIKPIILKAETFLILLVSVLILQHRSSHLYNK